MFWLKLDLSTEEFDLLKWIVNHYRQTCYRRINNPEFESNQEIQKAAAQWLTLGKIEIKLHAQAIPVKRV